MAVLSYSVIGGFFEGVRPEPRLTVSEWSDAHRFLSSVSSAEPGQWRTSRVPYLREVMDKLSAINPAEEVVVQKGAQLGFTEAGNNWIGYVIDVAPAPTLMVMPTEETAKTNSKIRIEPMIENAPRLREKILPSRTRDSDNTILQKGFPGGTLIMAGANSPARLRSLPIRNLFLDEVDGYPADVGGEGSPVDLATARTRAFARKKIFKISTPTIEGASIIEAEFETTDKRYYFVPCPECGVPQRLKWENVKWDKGKPLTTTYYECEHCEFKIQEFHKNDMLAAGEWIATVPEAASTVRFGYHLSSLYSPAGMFSWAQAAQLWENAQGDTSKLKTFVNTVLGETWRSKGEAPDWMRLFERRESYPTGVVPAGVGIITAGIDVQKDRLEMEVVGWGVGRRTWSLGYHVFPGDTAGKAVWDDLFNFMMEPLRREDGTDMPIHSAAVDTGYNTTEAYDFVNRFNSNKVLAVKGQERQKIILSQPQSVSYRVDGKRAGTVRLWNIGVNILKGELYGWLNQSMNEDGTYPAGYCHFPEEYDSHYFKMLTAERMELITNKRTNAIEYIWVKKHPRNEALDCRVYARAAASVLGIDRMSLEDWQAITGAATAAPPMPAPPSATDIAQPPSLPPAPATTPAPAPAPASVAPANTGKPAQKPGGSFWGRRR